MLKDFRRNIITYPESISDILKLFRISERTFGYQNSSSNMFVCEKYDMVRISQINI